MAFQKEELVGAGEHKYPVGYKCDIELYRMINKCSSLKDFTEWNTWIDCNSATEKYLQGIDLQGKYLKYANFEGVHFERANFDHSHCERVYFTDAHCECASFKFSDIKNVIFCNANCEGSLFLSTNMDSTIFQSSSIGGAFFFNVKFNQHTSITKCLVDDKTFFINVSLSSIIIEPGTRAFLERNTRKLAWYEWYPQQNFCTRSIAKAFWGLSDYGYNTTRIFIWFGNPPEK